MGFWSLQSIPNRKNTNQKWKYMGTTLWTLGFQYKQVVNVNGFPDFRSLLDNDQPGGRELPNFRVEKGRFSGKTVCFPENRFILSGIRSNSRETISFFRETDTLPTGIGPFFRKIGQIPGKQYRSSGKQVHFRLESGHISGKTICFPENIPILQGNWVISRRTASVFREKDLLPIAIIQFPLEIGLFSGKQHHSSGKQAYFPENRIVFPEKRPVAGGNYLLSVGNGFISRRTGPFFRETDQVPSINASFLPGNHPVSVSKPVL